MYGGDPMRWLAETPVAVAQACWTMLPRIRARQSLRAVHVAGIGAGTIKPERVLAQWERDAAGGSVAVLGARVPTLGDLAEIGLGAAPEPSEAGG